MRRLLSLALVLFLAASARATEAPKPNTLTPKEIADGWILLWDGESTFGWRSPNDSPWTIADGMLAPQADKPGLLVTTSPFRDYELVFEFRKKPESKALVTVGCDADGRPGADADARTLFLSDFGGAGWTAPKWRSRAATHRRSSTARPATYSLPRRRPLFLAFPRRTSGTTEAVASPFPATALYSATSSSCRCTRNPCSTARI